MTINPYIVSAFALAIASCGSDDSFDTRAQVFNQSGAMLSAWSNGDELIFAGGALSESPGTTFGGPGALLRIRDGEACRQQVSDRTVWWIDGPAPGEFWAVGEGGLILHEKDGLLTDESVPTEANLYGVWTQSGPPIAVGGNPFGPNTGEIWRREDGTWVRIAENLPGVAFKVWHDWIVGDGVAWQIVDGQLIERFPPNQVKLLTVRGRGPDDVWAAGGFSLPVLLHWQGDQWSEVPVDPLCASNGLNGVWTGPDEDVWIAGFFRGVGRFDGERWYCPETPVTEQHFHAVWKHGDDFWWAGGDLFTAGGDRAELARYGDIPLEFDMGPCP